MRVNRISISQYVPQIDPIGETLISTDKRQPTLFEEVTDEIVLETEKQRAKRLVDRGIHVGCLWEQRKFLEDAGVEYITTGMGHITLERANASHIIAAYKEQRTVQKAILLDHSV